ncbi:hypothetical protein BKA70DRAFT_790377 [Coprinopsis sp. MPI-PUGE-AT-0042]|nr:hypothetical protein BKA70DRAFT_790377 [Coprinopsis sp. MPI-PUGE-AT-0042]
MSSSCTFPGNPDISGIGVRIAIYVQNFLCFIPALWALWNGKVTQGELDYAETQTTTNLVLAFAILISSVVQARTLGMTNYHATVVLSMSWMNNTNTFIYFILYIHHKIGLPEGKGRVEATWSAWLAHIKGKFYFNPAAFNNGDEEGGGTRNEGLEHSPRQTAKVLVKRIVLVLGSLHLTVMSCLGIWLWTGLPSFGKGVGPSTGVTEANDCALKTVLLTIVGHSVPFHSTALCVCSIVVYALFLVPGLNLMAPMALFLGAYFAHRRWNSGKKGLGGVCHPERRPFKHYEEPNHAYHLRLARYMAKRLIAGLDEVTAAARSWDVLPAFIGLTILLFVNVIFVIDIKLTLRQNIPHQDIDETQWGFGQILALLLLLLPLRELVEALLARRLKQRQRELDEDVLDAIRKGDLESSARAIQRGSAFPKPCSPGALIRSL